MGIFYRPLVTAFLFVFYVLFVSEAAWATLVIRSQTDVNVELVAYDGLTDSSLFKGSVAAEQEHKIDTLYRGLALLVFERGQNYPVIIGDKSFILKITTPADLPSFPRGGENDFFYKALSGIKSESKQYSFARLMIHAKQLLKSSHSIKSITELTAKKQEFQKFVHKHYKSLKHSDMLRRLIAQYFMMHEYADYHIKGAPATNIRIKYQKAVLEGVGSWLEILKPHIPEHEILNYCVSLYYKRSMVSLASLIVDNYPSFAYCQGVKNKTFSFPDNLCIAAANGTRKWPLETFKSKKIIAFVSDDCPISMVKTIIKTRLLADQKKDVKVIIATLEQLSENHIAMSRMVSNGNMLFINDEKWRKTNLAKKIKLPQFVEIGADIE